jgi:hypothetical protein
MAGRKQITNHLQLHVSSVIAGALALLILRQVLKRMGQGHLAEDLG